jgi:hypothetical protein
MRSRSLARPACAAALIVLCVSSTACASVPAWQRGFHAKPKMQPDPNPLAASFEQHVNEYREGSTGGHGTVGGGCGCN